MEIILHFETITWIARFRAATAYCFSAGR